jgi:Luciferase-like monooxygenase
MSVTTSKRLNFAIVADIRNPTPWQRPSAQVYAEVIDHLAAVEQLGYDAAWCIEHHFTGDDYMPSPLIVAAAIAARTKRMRLATNIAILPLYHPVRFAEAAALVDVLSNGRLDVGVGLGWQPDEYAGYGISLKERGARADESLEVIRRLWQGYFINSYAKLFATSKQSEEEFSDRRTAPIWSESNSTEELVKSGMLTVVTPEEAVKRINEVVAEVPLETIALNFYPPGLPVAQVHGHMALFARKVMPAFR